MGRISVAFLFFSGDSHLGSQGDNMNSSSRYQYPTRIFGTKRILQDKQALFTLYVLLIFLGDLRIAAAKEYRTLSSVKAAQTQIPNDALKALDELPEKKITLDLILGAGMKSSDSFQIVISGAASTEATKSRAEAALNTQMKVYAHTQDNQNEPQSSFEPARTLADGYGVGISKYFSTGTSLSFDLKHGSYSTESSAGSPIPASGNQFTTEASLGVSQQLWKDAFGVSTRKGLRAAELQSVAAKEGVVEGVEQWANQLIDFYYNVWLAQNGVRAGVVSLERRDRLVSITQTKLRRGTAEKPDFLQVEAAQIKARVDLSESRKGLNEVWRNLVTTLKFPESWLEIDPIHIPMGMDDPIARAQELCGRDNYLSQRPKITRTLAKFKSLSEAAQLGLEKSEGGFKPNLSLDFSLNANGINSDGGTSMEEVLSSSHPGWRAQITLSYPLGNDAAKAEYVLALSEKQRLESQQRQAESNLSIDWTNRCKDLYRRVEKVELLKEAFDKQMERVKLEESRFRFGRSPTMSVIQAGDEATAAEMAYLEAQADTRRVAWSIRYLGGDVIQHLEKIRGERFALTH
jgi:outer membrane protein TolC